MNSKTINRRIRETYQIAVLLRAHPYMTVAPPAKLTQLLYVDVGVLDIILEAGQQGHIREQRYQSRTECEPLQRLAGDSRIFVSDHPGQSSPCCAKLSHARDKRTCF
jgi:hypothetical protein